MDEKRILIADADPSAVEAFCQALGDQWTIASVKSGSEALAEMKERAYLVLVADLNLPELKDSELLNKIRSKYPKTVRIIAAEEADRERVVKRALGAHQFLQKPFEAATIKDAIERALVLDQYINSDRLRELVSRVRTLPTIPSVYLELTAALRSGNTTTTEVGGIIAQDMAMMTKLLQVVNSAYFGLPQRITDPAEAVAILGFETIKSMVMAVKLLGFYDKIKPGTFSIEALWRHSTAVAQTAKAIAFEHTDDRDLAEAAFTGGLLHDLGKVVLAANFDEQYSGAQTLARKQQMPACVIEAEIFGASHGAIGAYLLGLWGMPIELLEVAALHHAPSGAGNRNFSPLTAVHIANVLEQEKALDQDESARARLDEGYLSEVGVLNRLSAWRQEFGRPELDPPADKPAAPAKEANEGSGISTDLRSVVMETTPEEPAFTPVPPRASPEPKLSPRRRRPALAMSAAAILLLTGLLWGRFGTGLTETPPTVHAKPATPQTVPDLPANGATTPALNHDVRPGDPMPPTPQEPSKAPELVAATPVPEPTPHAELVQPAVEPAQPAPPAFPELKLQGIFLTAKNPSAIINGKTLHANETIKGARVLEIGPSNVTIEFQGERKTFNLRSK